MIRRNQQGQGVIESLLVLPVVMALVVLFLTFSFRSFLYFYSDFNLHEALVCASDSQASDCQSILQDKIQAVLLLGHIAELHVFSTSQKAQGVVRISFAKANGLFSPTAQEMLLKKELSLPLQGSDL